MTDNTTNLVFEILKSIQSDISEIKRIQVDILTRMSRLETDMLSVKRDAITLLIDRFEADINQHSINNRVNDRLDRIERRLELHD
jgi:hypothetical protein